LSGRGLCDELITRPEESYRLWCVVVCDLETSRICAPYIYDISSLRVNTNLTEKHVPITTSVLFHIQNFKKSMTTASHPSYLQCHPQHPTDPTGQERTSKCPTILVATGSIPVLWGPILTLSGPPFDRSNQPAVPNLANPCKINKVQGVSICITQPDQVTARINS